MYEPIVLKNSDLLLGDEADATDFAIQATSVALTPDVAIERIKTLKPAGRFSSVDDPEWTLEVGYVFGHNNSGTPADVALADYLLANNGKKVPFVFRPISGGEGYGGTVTLVAGGIGGDQGAFSTQTVSLPVEGQPTKTTAPAPPAG